MIWLLVSLIVLAYLFSVWLLRMFNPFVILFAWVVCIAALLRGIVTLGHRRRVRHAYDE